MNIDALLLTILALADLGFLVYLRHRRSRFSQSRRVSRSLKFAVQRELNGVRQMEPRRTLVLRRAS